MASAVLDNLEHLHVVFGRVTYASGVPVLSSNDESATIADTGTGDATITFGEAFRSAPQVLTQRLKTSHNAANVETVHVEQVTTTVVEFRFMDIDDTGAGATDIGSNDPPEDNGCMFIIIGERNV